MAISRPFLLLLLGAALLGATVLAVQNARTASDSDTAPALIQTDAAAPPTDGATAPTNTSSTSGPADTLKTAFDFGELKSARFDAKLGVGKSPAIHLTGAFAATPAKGLPDFKLRLSAGGVSGGLVSLGDKAYFVRGDTGWRVPAALWTPVVDNSPLGVHPSTWVRDAKSEGTDTVGGVKVEHVSASVDPKAVANDFGHAATQSGGKPPKAISHAAKRGELDAWVGSDDHILRRLSVGLTLASGARVVLDVRLSDVNKPQQIKAPAHVRAGAPSGAFGALAQGLAGNIGRATGAGSSSLAALTSPNPRRATRAVHNHKKVVIVFGSARGLDDRAMVPVIRDVNRRTQALVLTDDVDAVERYGKLLEDLGVSQTPSIVIIGRSGKARLIEGYVDSQTLTQAVADAR